MREVMDAAGREAYRLAEDLGITMLPIFGKTADEVLADDQYAVDLLDAVLASYSLPDTQVAVLRIGNRAVGRSSTGSAVTSWLRGVSWAVRHLSTTSFSTSRNELSAVS